MKQIEQSGYEKYLEKPVVILLRDNRYIFGTLKSYDQYNSVVINYTLERIFYDRKYAERSHGLIVLRGENIVFIGTAAPPKLTEYKMGNYEILRMEMEKGKLVG